MDLSGMTILIVTHFLLPLYRKIILKSFEGNSISYLYASRQFMNLIYAANILVFFGIGVALGYDFLLALAAAIVVGASPSWIRYKAMFHFDQPSLLCLSALVLLTIVLHSRKNICLAGSRSSRSYS